MTFSSLKHILFPKLGFRNLNSSFPFPPQPKSTLARSLPARLSMNPSAAETDNMSPQRKVQSDEGTHCAFFYGTLMVPDVFYSVCYGTKDVPDAIAKLHTFNPAILGGYCRRRVKYADYPGITEDKDHNVFGTYTTGLTRANMAKLDHFEGSEYVRKTVTVKLLEKVGDLDGEGSKLVEGEERTAEVYVYLHKRNLQAEEWDLEEFRREKLQRWTRDSYAFE